MKNNTKTQKNKSVYVGGVSVCIFLFGVVVLYIFMRMNQQAAKTISLSDGRSINPADFSTHITNTYFSLPIGTTFVYEAHTDEGTERNEIQITGETKNIIGVETLVYHDKVWLNNELVEDTSDYLAQHRNGDVWYFGENVDNYAKGKLVNHSGTWITGVNGALPGLWVKEKPNVGETYQQEYYKGEAEDKVTVLSLNETVKVPYGTFTHCLKTRDWTPLDPASLENKYYCPQVHTVVLEEDEAANERAELIDIKTSR